MYVWCLFICIKKILSELGLGLITKQNSWFCRLRREIVQTKNTGKKVELYVLEVGSKKMVLEKKGKDRNKNKGFL